MRRNLFGQKSHMLNFKYQGDDVIGQLGDMELLENRTSAERINIVLVFNRKTTANQF